MLTISESHVSLSFLSASLSLLCREVYEMLVVQQGFGNKAGTHTNVLEENGFGIIWVHQGVWITKCLLWNLEILSFAFF